MPPISRRRALQIGGLGVAATVVGAGGLTWQLRSGSGTGLRPDTGAGLVEPETLRSADGLLEVEPRAAEGPLRVAGREVTALGYNGGLPGPTLRPHPGDRLRLRLVNDLPDATNLHVHGLVVSPEGNADNVFVEVAPGGVLRPRVPAARRPPTRRLLV